MKETKFVGYKVLTRGGGGGGGGGGITIALRNSLIYARYIYEITSSKCQHTSFRVWLVQLSSIKFLMGYYLMSTSYHNVIYGHKYTIKQYNLRILIES